MGAFSSILLHAEDGELKPVPDLAPGVERIDVPMGPFIRLDSGAILAVDPTHALRSEDDGKTWERSPIFANEDDFAIREENALLQTPSGKVVLAFVNNAEREWEWNRELRDAPGAILPTYVVTSEDGGRSWNEPIKLHDAWTGAIRDIIQTKDGRIIFTSMMLLHDPGRHAIVTYSSDDDGKSWRRSNLIDLGGVGHHDGAMESTLEELKDGSILMLIRTNFDTFWEAISDDGGRYWRTLRPSSIAAPSAPGMLKRLASGRLVLVWNQLYPEGQTDYPKRGGDGQWSEHEAINHRDELSIAFSDDDGKTWSAPKVIARAGEGLTQVSYPFVFEVEPGKLWITSMRGNLGCVLDETDFTAQ